MQSKIKEGCSEKAVEFELMKLSGMFHGLSPISSNITLVIQLAEDYLHLASIPPLQVQLPPK